MGALLPDSQGPPRLIHAAELEQSNPYTMARLFNEAMAVLWPGGIRYDKLLLLLTDGAPYMLLAANGLRVSYPKMLHFTCASQAVQRVAETVRGQFRNVDLLISAGKKVFLKAPQQLQLLKEPNPALPEQAQPALAKWASWIDAAQYYAQNLDAIAAIVDALPEEDAAALATMKDMLAQSELRPNLSYIVEHLGQIPDLLRDLGQRGTALSESVAKVTTLRSHLSLVNGVPDERAVEQFDAAFARNPGWTSILHISEMLEGNFGIVS